MKRTFRPLALALGSLLLAACAGSQTCPTLDYDALARHVVDDVFRRLDPERADEARAPYEPGARPDGDDAQDVFATLDFDSIPCRGSRRAAVRVVVFSDFECPFCSRYARTLDRVVLTHGEDILVCFLNYPLPFHANAQAAAEAGLEAFDQAGDAGFHRMHDLMFEHQDSLTPEGLVSLAREAGLDAAQMREALEDHRHAELVDEDIEFGRELGVSGTPTTFVEGEEISGAVPYEQVRAAIEREIARRAE